MREMQPLDIPVAVEAYFEENGKLTPMSFSWQGRKVHISDVGRRWREGNVRHYLIMTSAQEIFELCLDVDTLRWRIAKAWKKARIG